MKGDVSRGRKGHEKRHQAPPKTVAFPPTYSINPSSKTSVHDSGDFSPIRIICEVVVGPLEIFAVKLKYA
jgi:hypothetical protein